MKGEAAESILRLRSYRRCIRRVISCRPTCIGSSVSQNGKKIWIESTNRIIQSCCIHIWFHFESLACTLRVVSTRQDVRLKDETIFSATSEESAKIVIIIVEFCRCQSLNAVTKPRFNSGVSTSLSDFISLEIQNTL